jgi:hypothetical protein
VGPRTADAVEVRYGRLHNASLAVIATAMVVVAISHFLSHPERAPALSLRDPRFVLFAGLALVVGFFAWQGAQRFANRQPQVVIDAQGIVLGFGRNKRFAWDEVQWVRLKRLALRPQLQIGLTPEAFVAADLRLTQWHLDDALRPVRGMPAALAVRDNGLDRSAAAMLDAVKSFRPNLVKT